MRSAIGALILWVAAMCGGAGGVGAAEIILYDFFDFGGQSVTLTDSAPNLGAYNFDNDLESFRVISGTWRIHRDANYQDNSGPSLTAGPGDYPNIEQLGYPQDRMSSVRLLVDPVAVSCPAPYQTPNSQGVACTYTCASGTVPDQASGQCVCQQGYVVVGADDQGRRICGPGQVEQPSAPVLQLACRRNSVPNAAGGCVCIAGTAQTGVDQQGRPICVYRRAETGGGTLRPTDPVMGQTPMPILPSPGQGAAEPPADAIHNVPGGTAYEVARANGFSFYVDTPTDDATECAYQIMPGGALGLNVIYESSLIPGLLSVGDVCVFRMFGSRQLAAGWSFFGRIDPDSDVCGVGWLEFINEGYAENPAFQISIIADKNYKRSLGRNCLIHRWTISRLQLRGPAGADWRNAFQ